MTAALWDPLDPEVRRDPYPRYAELRRSAPVYRVPSTGFWAVSRYADVVEVLRDPERFSSAAMAAAVQRPVEYSPEPEDRGPPVESIVGSDPPAHTRLRAIVNRGFTPGRIARLEPHVREVARALAAKLPAGGECDLVADFAVPLPVTVIAELLGVGPERHADFKRWSDAMIRATFGSVEPTEGAEITRSLEEMRDWLDAAIAERRERPGPDLISALVRAEAEQGALSHEEMRVFAFTLLVAGNVTITLLIANGVLALLRHPGQLALASGDPSVIPALVEEVLRWDAPAPFLFRTATREVEIAGTKLPEGATIATLFASANRDEAVYRDAERFDLRRNPKDHLAFGHGIHFCLGAALARLEARVAFETLLAGGRRLALAEREVEPVDALIFRGPKRLRVAIEG